MRCLQNQSERHVERLICQSPGGWEAQGTGNGRGVVKVLETQVLSGRWGFCEVLGLTLSQAGLVGWQSEI